MDNVRITPFNLWKQMLDKKHLLGFNNGFTIPFIVGAYYRRGFLKDGDLQTSQCIRFVFTNILETVQRKQPLVIFKCGTKEKLVLQYVTDGERTHEGIESIIKKHYNIDRVIYLDFDVFQHPYTLDTLIAELWNRYQEPITNHTFSYESRAWRTLNKREQNFIDNDL
ncbi:hypothetical protein [uncultured Alistipes sp.]|uniref:hypothetical protein n=1 Tax=uncultured Alistipes sp. TaxID=538949 RepID=UPI000E9D14EA|nr:hypothetical protein [uncultured Alistipes sp.]HBV81884.1 hypothetical protein [Lachnospiraceae bacterium]